MAASYAGRLVSNALMESTKGSVAEYSFESVALMSLMMSAGGELSVTSETGKPKNLRNPSRIR